eukprot:TRINITY_DN8570_c0_g5_i2.p1 TRINITY_DN8570_c0_g5~~TRINITY_DN8570_c0_g5_i2.p1  ORF type:complete len:445 (+),score=102.51 TRINITY_DN8570_c0_g5_i2:33-1367(+)
MQGRVSVWIKREIQLRRDEPFAIYFITRDLANELWTERDLQRVWLRSKNRLTIPSTIKDHDGVLSIEKHKHFPVSNWNQTDQEASILLKCSKTPKEIVAEQGRPRLKYIRFFVCIEVLIEGRSFGAEVPLHTDRANAILLTEIPSEGIDEVSLPSDDAMLANMESGDVNQAMTQLLRSMSLQLNLPGPSDETPPLMDIGYNYFRELGPMINAQAFNLLHQILPHIGNASVVDVPSMLQNYLGMESTIQSEVEGSDERLMMLHLACSDQSNDQLDDETSSQDQPSSPLMHTSLTQDNKRSRIVHASSSSLTHRSNANELDGQMEDIRRKKEKGGPIQQCIDMIHKVLLIWNVEMAFRDPRCLYDHDILYFDVYAALEKSRQIPMKISFFFLRNVNFYERCERWIFDVIKYLNPELFFYLLKTSAFVKCKRDYQIKKYGTEVMICR